MSLIQTWFQDLEKLSENKLLNIKLEKFKAVKLIESTEIFSLSAIQEKLQSLGEITGWIQETGQVHCLYQQNFSAQSIVLNGEWLDVDTSYSLEHLGRNQWELRKYTLKDCSLVEATHLAEEMKQCQVGKNNNGFLVYQRLWQPQSGVPVAKLAIFSGFQE